MCVRTHVCVCVCVYVCVHCTVAKRIFGKINIEEKRKLIVIHVIIL